MSSCALHPFLFIDLIQWCLESFKSIQRTSIHHRRPGIRFIRERFWSRIDPTSVRYSWGNSRIGW